jgi:hypothetical protein
MTIIEKNKKILEIMKLAREITADEDKDYTGFEGKFNAGDGRLFKIKLSRWK